MKSFPSIINLVINWSVGAFNNIFREAKATPPFPFLFFLFPSHCGLPLTPRGTVPAIARRAVSSPSIPCFIVCNITQCLLLQLIILFRSYSRRWGDDEMCQVPHTRTNVYKYSFFPTTVCMWNTLPSSLLRGPWTTTWSKQYLSAVYPVTCSLLWVRCLCDRFSISDFGGKWPRK